MFSKNHPFFPIRLISCKFLLKTRNWTYSNATILHLIQDSLMHLLWITQICYLKNFNNFLIRFLYVIGYEHNFFFYSQSAYDRFSSNCVPYIRKKNNQSGNTVMHLLSKISHETFPCSSAASVIADNVEMEYRFRLASLWIYFKGKVQDWAHPYQ